MSLRHLLRRIRHRRRPVIIIAAEEPPDEVRRQLREVERRLWGERP